MIQTYLGPCCFITQSLAQVILNLSQVSQVWDVHLHALPGSSLAG